MKPINEIITDLVARGFELPEGLKPPGLGAGCSGYNCWELIGESGASFFDTTDQRLLAMIACEFARQRRERANMDHNQWKAFMFQMLDGETEDALRALHEAVCE